jgi:hypothetical protein
MIPFNEQLFEYHKSIAMLNNENVKIIKLEKKKKIMVLIN